MKLLYGTGNPAKLAAMRSRLAELPVEIMGLKDMPVPPPQAEETGSTPLENALQKALCYYKAYRLPVFSCDSGLYFENAAPEDQPGVHVRTIQGKTLTDEEMTAHYTALAKKYGGLVARYRNAIALVLDESHIYCAMDDTFASEPFLLVDTPHPRPGQPGFPLDPISVHIPTGKYYFDLPPEALETVAVEDGFLEFFKRHLPQEEIK